MSNFLSFASRNTPLAAGVTWTSPWVDVSDSSSVTSIIIADAHCHLYMEFSPDQTFVFTPEEFECLANLEDRHKLSVIAPWFRVRVKNGPDDQTQLYVTSMKGHQSFLTAHLNEIINQDADSLPVRNLPAELDIMQGKLGGFNVVNKLGKNSNLASGTSIQFITEAGGTYTGFPISDAETIAISSDNINDTAAGSGARSVFIIGLNENWELISETVILNGLTPVNTVNTYRRAHTMFVTDSGDKTTASTINAGTITATHSTTTSNVFLTILPEIGSSNYAVYTIPAGKIGYLYQYAPQIRKGVSSSIDGSFWIRPFGGAPRHRRPFEVSQGGYPEGRPYGGLQLPEKTDIAAIATDVSVGSISAAVAFDIILVDIITPI